MNILLYFAYRTWIMTDNEKYAIMRLPIFAELVYDEMEIVGKKVSSCQFQAGEVLLKEGTHGGAMYFVVDGTLEVIKQNEEGKEVVIAKVTSGQSVGEMSIIEGIVRSATVRAVTEGSLLTLKREDFETLLDEYPKIGVKILKGISCSLSMNLRKMSNISAKLTLSIV